MSLASNIPPLGEAAAARVRHGALAQARRFIAADEKRAIGKAAAALVPNQSSLFINIGTTTEEVAAGLMGHVIARSVLDALLIGIAVAIACQWIVYPVFPEDAMVAKAKPSSAADTRQAVAVWEAAQAGSEARLV